MNKKAYEALKDFKCWVSTPRKEKVLQGNVFGLQDPHRLTTVAFDSVGTSILVLDDKAKLTKFLKNKNSVLANHFTNTEIELIRLLLIHAWVRTRWVVPLSCFRKVLRLFKFNKPFTTRALCPKWLTLTCLYRFSSYLPNGFDHC